MTSYTKETDYVHGGFWFICEEWVCQQCEHPQPIQRSGLSSARRVIAFPAGWRTLDADSLGSQPLGHQPL